MAALQVADPEKASALKEKDTWRKALQLAQGEKVKDDVKLLKKTIKREETFKKKSSKEWGERKSTVSKQKDNKQKRREENLKSRIDAAKNKGKKDKGDKKGDKKGAKKGGKPKAVSLIDCVSMEGKGSLRELRSNNLMDILSFLCSASAPDLRERTAKNHRNHQRNKTALHFHIPYF